MDATGFCHVICRNYRKYWTIFASRYGHGVYLVKGKLGCFITNRVWVPKHTLGGSRRKKISVSDFLVSLGTIFNKEVRTPRPLQYFFLCSPVSSTPNSHIVVPMDAIREESVNVDMTYIYFMCHLCAIDFSPSVTGVDTHLGTGISARYPVCCFFPRQTPVVASIITLLSGAAAFRNRSLSSRILSKSLCKATSQIMSWICSTFDVYTCNFFWCLAL